MVARRRKDRCRGKQLAFTGLIVLFLAFFVLSTLYQQGSISADLAQELITTIISLSFPFAALTWMYFRGGTTKRIFQSLGLAKDCFSLKMLAMGALIFLIVILMELSIGTIVQVTGVQINTNASIVFANAPLWFVLFVTIIGPIDEEIFFRGFAVPRIGIIPSALVFGLLHASYGSTFGVEIIAAFIFGVITGYVFKRTKSLYPGIVAHILVNSLTATLALIFLHLV